MDNNNVRSSRSLTDLQKSLDKACVENVNQREHQGSVKHDSVYKSASENLENMLNKHSSEFESDIQNKSDGIYLQTNNNTVDSRDAYMNTLRDLARNHKQIQNITSRSQSFESLLNPRKPPVTRTNMLQKEHVDTNNYRYSFSHDKDEENDVDDSISRMKMKHEKEIREMIEIIDGLKRRVVVARERESALLSHQEDLISTTELAQEERHKAVLESAQKDEEIDRLREVISQQNNDWESRMRQEITDNNANTKETIECLSKERNQMTVEIGQLNNQLKRSEQDKARFEVECDTMRQKMIHEELERNEKDARVSIERKEMERQLDKMRSQLLEQQSTSQSELLLIQDDLSEKRQRLTNTETKLTQILEENMHLLEENRRLHVEQDQMVREIDQKHRDNTAKLKETVKKLSERLKKMENVLENKNKKYKRDINDADELLRAQSELVVKLRQELEQALLNNQTTSRSVYAEMDELNGQLDMSNQENKELRKRCRELQENIVSQDETILDVRKRVQETEDLRKTQDKQILDLMQEKNELMHQIEMMKAKRKSKK